MCGVATTCGMEASAQSAGGSFSNTSRPAAATIPLSIASFSAASSISSPRAVLMIRMPGFIFASRSSLNEVVRLGGRREVKRQEVGGGADLVERQQLDAHAFGEIARDERVVGDDAHAERAGALRDFLADAAEPGDAERLASQLGAEEALLLPLRLLHRAVGGRNDAGQRQHERARVLGDADAVGARRVDDEDAARAGRGDIDVVDAGAGAGDDPQLWGR